jgi:OOP family OmpA-OmpF porin
MVYHFQETPSPTAAQVIAEPVAKPAAEPFPVPEVVPVVVPVAPRLQEYCSILDFQFEVNQTDIQRQEKEKLRVIGTFLRKYPGTSAVIEGYSDNVGKLDANLRLSQRRADAVVRYLVDTFNIAPARLSAVAYGESHPVGDILTAHPSVTATVEGHTANLQATPALALSISELRAQNVVNYLADNFGVARSRLSAEGFGDTRRVAYNTSPQGQQENRRVDVIINYPK